MVDAEFDFRVCRQGVFRGEFNSDLVGEFIRETTLPVETGELFKLFTRHRFEFPLFLRDDRFLRVALGAHRHVLATGHGERARDDGGDTGGCDGEHVVRCGCRDTDDDARRLDDAVVCAEHSGPQPVQTLTHVRHVGFSWMM